MGLKEIIICPDIGKLRPFFYIHRVLIQIVDLRPMDRQKKRRVRGNDQLTVKEPGGIFQKLRQLLLPLRRQAVLRLVQKIEPRLLHLFLKIQKSALPVGVLPHIVHQHLPDKF